MSNRAKPVVAVNIKNPRNVKVTTSVRSMARTIGTNEDTARKSIGNECNTGGGEYSISGEKWYVEYY